MKRFTNNIVSIKRGDADVDKVYKGAVQIWPDDTGVDLNLFVAASETGTNRVATSPDGITWTLRTTTVAAAFKRHAYSPQHQKLLITALGPLVSGVNNINRYMESDDALTYSTVPAPVLNTTTRGAAYSKSLGIFSVVSDVSNTQHVSYRLPNNTSWTSSSYSIGGYLATWEWVESKSSFFGVGYNGVWVKSSDGLNITSGTSSGLNTAGGYEGLVYSKEQDLFVACNFTGTQRISTSNDGENWTLRTAPLSAWVDIAYSPALNLYVIVANNAVATSPDGINWTSRSPSANRDWRSVCWSETESIFVATSLGSNTAMTSANGINWTSRTMPFSGFWSFVRYY